MRHSVSLLLTASALALLPACNRSGGGGGGGTPIIISTGVTFETREEIPLGTSTAIDGTLVDLNGDGILDLATALGGGQISLRIGQVGGTFTDGGQVSVGGGLVFLGSGDLDGDGDQDLMAVRAPFSAAVPLLNDGAGNMTIGTAVSFAGTIPTAVTLGDFDGDGVLDFAASFVDGPGVGVFMGNGDGTFGAAIDAGFPASMATAGLLMVDADENGVTDIVVCDVLANRLLIAAGQVGGGYNLVEVPVGAFPLAVSAGDVNNDGQIDLVVSNYDDQTLSVVTRLPIGYVSLATIPVVGPPANTLVTDIDRDGLQDLVACIFRDSCVNVFRGVAGAPPSAQEQVLCTGSPFRALSGDVDGDATPDLVVVSNGTSSACLYRSRPGGVRGARTIEPGLADQPASWVATGDFDGDGAPEIATASFGGSLLSIVDIEADANGRATAAGTTTLDVGRTVQNLEAADLDQDGQLDLVVTVAADGPNQGGVIVLQNTTVAGAPPTFDRVPAGIDAVLVGGLTPTGTLVADVDGDGDADLCAAFGGDQVVRVLRRNGAGLSFAPAEDVAVGGRPVGMAAGDFDGDGDLEIGITRTDLASIRVVGIDQTSGMFETVLDVPVGQIPLQLKSGDVNEDGLDDLVVTNVGSDSLTLMIAQAQGGFANQDFAAGLSPTALLVQDLDQDGNLDILAATLDGYDFRVLVGDGSGSFSQVVVFPGAYNASAAALADLTSDGKLELVVASIRHRRLAVFQLEDQ
jgi:hypothetical protein